MWYTLILGPIKYIQKKEKTSYGELYGLVRGEYKHLMPHFLVSAALPTNYDFQEYTINLY